MEVKGDCNIEIIKQKISILAFFPLQYQRFFVEAKNFSRKLAEHLVKRKTSRTNFVQVHIFSLLYIFLENNKKGAVP
jgi:hypothetical protein